MHLWNKITDNILNIIDLPDFSSEGAYSLRHNGIVLCQGDTEFVKIKQKSDKKGMDVFISGKAKGETVHVPVVVDSSGITDIVYNDFYIEAGADVTIISGCGIHNNGCNESRHDGIHSFHVQKSATVRYEENTMEKVVELVQKF